jgi:hypothetical protein
MGGRRAASVAPLIALVIIAVAVPSTATEGEKSRLPPPPYYYYSPSPPASYPCSSGNCPMPPGEYIRIRSTPSGKGLLYPQDPGFMLSSASRRTVPIAAF